MLGSECEPGEPDSATSELLRARCDLEVRCSPRKMSPHPHGQWSRLPAHGASAWELFWSSVDVSICAKLAQAFPNSAPLALMRLVLVMLLAGAFHMPVLDGQSLESAPTNASNSPWEEYPDQLPVLESDPTVTNRSSANGSLPPELADTELDEDNQTHNATFGESEYLLETGSDHRMEKLRSLILPSIDRRRISAISPRRRSLPILSPRRRSLSIPSPRRRSLPIPSPRRRSLPIPSPRRRSLPIPSPRRRSIPSFRRRADLIRRRINDPTRRRRSFQDMQRRRGVDLPTDLHRRRRTFGRRRRTRRRQYPVCQQWVTCKNFYYKGVYCGPDNRLCLHWR